MASPTVIGTPTSGGHYTSATTLTVSATVPTATQNNALIVIVKKQAASSTVTWNGTSMTQIASFSAAQRYAARIYFLAAPETGTHDIVVTYATSQGEKTLVAFTLQDVVQDSGTVLDASGQSSGADVTADSKEITTTVDNDLVVAILDVAFGATSITVNASQTVIAQSTPITDEDIYAVSSISKATAGAITTGYTWTTNKYDDFIAMSFKYVAPTATANTNSIDLEVGSAQSLSIASASQTGLAFSSDFTIEAWIRPESAGSAGSRPIVTRYDNSIDTGYRVDLTNAGRIRCSFSTANAATLTQVSSSNVVIPNMDETTWYHVAVTADISASTIIIYINGSSVALGAYDSQNATTINTGARVFYIGTMVNAGDADRLFDGLIDEVRVWSVIRTSGEISANYQTELVGNESNLVAYYKLNNSLLDETANNNDLTNNGSAVFSTTVPFSGSAAVSPPKSNLLLLGVG